MHSEAGAESRAGQGQGRTMGRGRTTGRTTSWRFRVDISKDVGGDTEQKRIFYFFVRGSKITWTLNWHFWPFELCYNIPTMLIVWPDLNFVRTSKFWIFSLSWVLAFWPWKWPWRFTMSMMSDGFWNFVRTTKFWMFSRSSKFGCSHEVPNLVVLTKF